MAQFLPNEDGTATMGLSGHRLFPAIVALWFAALLGLGFLVLPGILVERLVAASGLAAILPAAAPPLGMTARMLIALAAALAGAGLGFVIAQRVAAAQGGSRPARESRNPSRAPEVARRPISAKEELGSELLDTPPDEEAFAPLRRRSLALQDLAPADEAEKGEPEPARLDENEALLDEDFAETVSWDLPSPELSDAELGEPAFTDSLGLTETEDPVFTETTQAAESAWNDAFPRVTPERATSEPARSERTESERTSPPPLAWSAAAKREEAPLDELGIAALVERLGRSLQNRRLASPARDDLLERIKAAGAVRDPAAEEGEGQEELEEVTPPSALRGIATGLDSFGEDESGEDEDETESPDAGYSSLLGMKRPFRNEEAEESGNTTAQRRPFDPPSEAPPAELPSAPATDEQDADRALRSALENLQRISGTA